MPKLPCNKWRKENSTANKRIHY
jgi:hypothetical protein